MTADRGAYIGPGYIKGKGPVDVYASANGQRLHALTRRGEWLYVSRERVIFTKQKKG